MDIFYSVTATGTSGCVQVGPDATVQTLKTSIQSELEWDDAVELHLHDVLLDSDTTLSETALGSGDPVEVSRCIERVLSMLRRGQNLKQLPTWTHYDRRVSLAAVRQDGANLQYTNFQDDREVVRSAIASDRRSFRFASEDIRDDIDFVRTAIHDRIPPPLTHAGPSVLDDEEIALSVAWGPCFAFISADLRGDLTFMLKAVERSCDSFVYATTELRDNRKLAELACSHQGSAIKYCSARLRGDRELVVVALKSKVPSSVLSLVDEEMRSDEELCLLQLSRQPHYMRDTVSHLRNNKNFVIRAVLETPSVVPHLTPRWHADYDVMYAAVSGGGLYLEHCADNKLTGNKALILKALAYPNAGIALKYANKTLRGDKDVALAAIRGCVQAWQLISDDLKKDPEVSLAVVNKNGDMLYYLQNSCKEDHSIVEAAVRQNPRAYRSASDALKADRSIALSAFSRDGSMLQHAPESLRDDLEVVTAAVQSRSRSIRYASNRLKSVRELALLAVEKDGAMLSQVSAELQDDKEVVRVAYVDSQGSLNHASERLREDDDFYVELQEAAKTKRK